MFAEAFARLPEQPKPTGVEEFRERQQRLTSQFRSTDLLIVSAPAFAVHSNDVEYRYRTSSDLLYLTGWTEPESILVLRNSKGSWLSALFVQPKDTLKEIWEGRRPGVEGALADFAVDEAYDNNHLAELQLEPIQGVDAQQIAAQRRGVLLALIDGGNDQLVDAVPEDQQGDADQVVVDAPDHLADQQGAGRMGEETLHDFAQHADLGIGADRKAAHTAEQAHHHRHQRHQAKAPDQSFEAAFHAG